MVRLFKKQRRGSGSAGPAMRYAKYALGEIVLVVVGILIALQINDWYQERLDRKTESEYLLSMQRDLAEDTRELREAIKGNLHLLAGLDDTLHLLAEPQDDEAWRRDLYIHGIKYTYWFVLMEFSRLTMAQLQYSGGMRLISNTRVREAMIALNILTLMYQRQLQLADSLSALIEEQYGDQVTR